MLEPFEEFAYRQQTMERGLVDPNIVRLAFARMAARYRHYFANHLPATGRALDVACGYGNFTFFLREQGLDVEGVDLDPSQVEIARRLDLPVFEGEALHWLAGRRDLSVVTMIDFIEHIDKNVALDALHKARGAMHENGLLILRAPSADGPFGAHDFANDLTHRWMTNAYVLSMMLRGTGFADVVVHDDYPPPIGAKGVAQYLAYRAAKAFVGLLALALGSSRPTVVTRSMWVRARAA